MTDLKDSNKIYFTIKPHNTGFSDQLNQFDALYRFGRSLGFKYFHSDFNSMRSTYGAWNFRPDLRSRIELFIQLFVRIMKYKVLNKTSGDVFNFLGFNSYFKGMNDKINIREFKKIYIVLDTYNSKKHSLNTLKGLKKYVEDIINSYDSANKFVIFQVKHERSFIRPIFSNIPKHTDLRCLRSQYFLERKKDNWRSMFDPKRIKVLIHIRLGDTAYINTPWGTIISVYFLLKNSFVELNDLSELESQKYVNFSNYSTFLRKANEYFYKENISLLCFSDGFKRTFEKIYRAKNKLKLTRKKVKLLLDSEKDYEQRYFSELNSYSNLKTIIGENKNNLFDLIHSIFCADVIIIGTRQRMIIQFLGTYFDIDSIPIVVVIYKKNIPRYNSLGTDIIDKRFVFFDVEKQNYEEILSEVNLKISCSRELPLSSQ